MASKKNVIVGAAQVFIGPSISDATGADDTARLAAWRTSVRATGTTKQGTFIAGVTGWRDVGFTTDGLSVTNSPTWEDVPVDQLLDAAKIFKSGMTMQIATSFAEATLENLLVAWGQHDTTLTSSGTAPADKELDMDGGSLGDYPVERGLIAVGNAPEKPNSNAYGERTYFAYRVLSVESSEHTLAKSDPTAIPVTFRALPAVDGKYGSIRDRLGV